MAKITFEEALEQVKSNIDKKKNKGVDFTEDQINRAIITLGGSYNKFITYTQADNLRKAL